MIWLMCWTKYVLRDGTFSPEDSGAVVMVNVAHIMAITAAPPFGVTAVRVGNYGIEAYVPGTPEQVVLAISTWPAGRGAHIDMRSEVAR